MYGSGEPESAFHVDRRHEEPQHDIQEHGTSGIVAGKHSRRRPNRVLSMPSLPTPLRLSYTFTISVPTALSVAQLSDLRVEMRTA